MRIIAGKRADRPSLTVGQVINRALAVLLVSAVLLVMLSILIALWGAAV